MPDRHQTSTSWINRMLLIWWVQRIYKISTHTDYRYPRYLIALLYLGEYSLIKKLPFSKKFFVYSQKMFRYSKYFIEFRFMRSLRNHFSRLLLLPYIFNSLLSWNHKSLIFCISESKWPGLCVYEFRIKKKWLPTN